MTNQPAIKKVEPSDLGRPQNAKYIATTYLPDYNFMDISQFIAEEMGRWRKAEHEKLSLAQKEIHHILNKLRPRRGNQWYKDNSSRTVSTLCGADVTRMDVSRVTKNTNKSLICDKCLSLYINNDNNKR